jgi:hypothetical protein
MAATQKSTIDQANATFFPPSNTFRGNLEKFKKIFKTLPSMGFSLEGCNWGLNQPNYFYIKKEEREEVSVAALSDVSRALSIQYGITGTDGQPIRVITETKWAANLPPQIILLDEDIQKLDKEFIFANVEPLCTYVDDEKKASGSKFIFFGDSSNPKEISIAAAEKLITSASKRPEI